MNTNEWQNPYSLEELLPIVAKLAKQYTGGESSSITYATAQQLMASVIFCLQTAAAENSQTLLPSENTQESALAAYKRGLSLAESKVQQALQLYQQILRNFNDYENYFLHSTIYKGMPEFFQRYDLRFAAHEHILTLDYPVRQDLSAYQGIDKIYAYLQCIDQEQKFLASLTPEFVRQTLIAYNPFYRDTPDNLLEIVLNHLQDC